jgi:hypothetical protein
MPRQAWIAYWQRRVDPRGLAEGRGGTGGTSDACGTDLGETYFMAGV